MPLSRISITAAIAAASIALAAGCSTDPDRQLAKDLRPTTTITKADTATSAPAATSETTNQENARESAQDYLDYSAFSRPGLIKQLKFEGYSTADATYAVGAVKVNWYAQAAKSAKAYLDLTSFSRSGLIDQLVFEGYTPAQATYGVNQTGLR